MKIELQNDGCTCALHSKSRRKSLKELPDAQLTLAVFIGSEKQTDFKRIQSPMWKQIALMLTGLSEQQFQSLGGFEIYDSALEKVVYDSTRPKTYSPELA